MLFLLLNFRLQTATSMLSHHEMHEEVFQTKTKKRQQNAKRRTNIRLKARQKLKDSRALHQLPTFMDLEEDEINAIIDKMEHITRYSSFFYRCFLYLRVLCFFSLHFLIVICSVLSLFFHLFCFVSLCFFLFFRVIRFKGNEICHQHDASDSFYIITKGTTTLFSLQNYPTKRCSLRFGLFSAASLF